MWPSITSWYILRLRHVSECHARSRVIGTAGSREAFHNCRLLAVAYRCNLLSSMSSVPVASTVSRASSPVQCDAGMQSNDVHTMLMAIFNQNSQILAQNVDMNSRLAEVEKAQQRSHRQFRPRSKCADGFDWKCPVCLESQKHFDSFLSHIRKLAVNTVHRPARARRAKCCFNLENRQHQVLVSKFPGASGPDQAASFASHFLHVCRSISASRVAADKHRRVFEWLHTVVNDPHFSVAGECPEVSNDSSPGSGLATSGGSSDSHRIRLGGK